MSTVKKLRREEQSGIALVTSLLLMLLMATLLAGFIALVVAGQQITRSSSNDALVFYGAEAGLEKLTGDLGTLFGNNYAPTGAEVNTLMTAPPDLSAQGVTFVDPSNVSTYKITFPPDGNGNPLATAGTINNGSSPWNGMSALLTPYTIYVTAWTNDGNEAQLTRSMQSVGIPLFQFGVFSQTDLGFHSGTDFSFGGRVHTNGNLFLAQDTGTLTMSQKVTAVGQVVRNNLMNGYTISGDPGYQGTVSITTGSGYRNLNFGEGSVTGMPNSSANPQWPLTIEPAYHGNLLNNVKPLKLEIALLGAADPVEVIRRPAAGEGLGNPILGERYFSQASLRILISDNAADITNLPCVSLGAPFNLADIALPVTAWSNTPGGTALLPLMTAAGTTPLPLAASGSLPQNGSAYNSSSTTFTHTATFIPVGNPPLGSGYPGDGYWVTYGNPLINGYIKIDAQTSYGNPCGNWKDVTLEILSLGYVGPNLNPGPKFAGTTNALDPNWKYNGAGYQTTLLSPLKYGKYDGGADSFTADYPALAAGTSTTMAPPILYPLTNWNYGVNCSSPYPSPHPNAVIRLERVRDNPSSIQYCQQNGNTCKPGQNNLTATTPTMLCGVDNAGNVQASLQSNPTDFWPQVLYDTREGVRRDIAPASGLITLGGNMHYVELDVKNLARWLAGKIGTSGTSTYDPTTAPNDFVVYFSDRRGNYVPLNGPEALGGAWPPRSPSGNETGEYGFSDFVNPASPNGCPNGALDAGEDVDQVNTWFDYGQDPTPAITSLAIPPPGGYTTFWAGPNAVPSPPLTADPNCVVNNPTKVWPGTYVTNTNEARQNPPLFFRRALKIDDGNLISVTGWQANCGGTGNPCGLTIAAENPAYVQGDYNANSGGHGFGDPNVAASVDADAITLLSSNWNDFNSFSSPYLGAACSGAGNRNAANADYYRMGVLSGKGLAFPLPSYSASNEFGDDGGIHNFLRFLENWNNNNTVNYEGSIVSLAYNRQATGVWKYAQNCVVYTPPNRNYNFDVNFLTPALLPPRTPMFRDINIEGFTQILLPD